MYFFWSTIPFIPNPPAALLYFSSFILLLLLYYVMVYSLLYCCDPSPPAVLHFLSFFLLLQQSLYTLHEIHHKTQMIRRKDDYQIISSPIDQLQDAVSALSASHDIADVSLCVNRETPPLSQPPTRRVAVFRLLLSSFLALSPSN